MDPPRIRLQNWTQLEEICQQALDKSAAERADFLKNACAGNVELLHEVKALLAYHEKADDFLEESAMVSAAQTFAQTQNSHWVGRQLGAYQILAFLGAGGMGEVFLARDTRLDRTVALKILPQHLTEDLSRLRRFEREAKAASALNHPNIAVIHEIGELEGLHFMAMEHVEGQNLGLLVQKAPLPFKELVHLAVQAADALEEAHNKGIIHRDVKPGNLMVTKKGHLKILDFGLAKKIPGKGQKEGLSNPGESRTTPGLVMGTVEYMSPEQLLGQEIDHRTDLFSLGITLYQMATGKLPFKGNSPTETMDQILHAEPLSILKSDHKVPPELDRIIRKCLEKDKDDRYQSAKDLLVDLRNLKRDTETHVKVSALPQSKPRYRLERFALVMGILAIMLGAAWWVWSTLHRRDSPIPLVAVPFTGNEGDEAEASFSPDGSQVAYSWQGGNQGQYDIYIKQIGGGPPLRLTRDPRPDRSPSWSPDGRSIAFLRSLGKGHHAVMLMPPLGGSERQLVEIQGLFSFFDVQLAWTPDNKFLILPDQDPPDSPRGLFLISLGTGEKKRLTSPRGRGDYSPAVSPDGRNLVFVRWIAPSITELFLLRLNSDFLPDGEERQLTRENQLTMCPTWLPDGKGVLFGVGAWHFARLWRLKIADPQRPERLPFLAEDAYAPVVSRVGHRLLFRRIVLDINIWRYDSPLGNNPVSPPRELIASKRGENVPRFSPDDRRIAFISDRSGTTELWISDADGQNCVQLTSLGGPVPDLPSWSPDSRRITFHAAKEGQTELFMIGAQGGTPIQLTHTPCNEEAPYWSKDGNWIYFGSDGTGQFQVWRMSAYGGEPVQITRNGGSFPAISADGAYVYFLKGREWIKQLWKVPASGGDESLVLDSIETNNFAVANQGIFFMPWEKTERNISFLSFSDRQIHRLVQLPDKGASFGFSVSSNERAFLFTQIDRSLRDLMLVENFR